MKHFFTFWGLYEHVLKPKLVKGSSFIAYNSVSGTFPNFIAMCGYRLHVMFCVIAVLDARYVSVKYQAKMTSVKA